jgi:hypothetical protein
VVGGAAADDDRHADGADELLEVQRLGRHGDVLGRHDRALDDEDVQARLERELVVLRDALGRQGRRR